MNNLIGIISHGQETNGSFNNGDMLISSLILNELATLKINSVTKSLSAWIMAQKNNNWDFSNNLLTNFLATAAILKNNPEFLDGRVLGKILNNLTSQESQEGGPYYSAGNKIELGANCAIAYFLFLNKVELPNLTNLIETAIDKNNFGPDKYLTIYLIAKFYQGAKKQELINYILNSLTGLDNFDHALALNALYFLGENIGNLVKTNADSPLEVALYLKIVSAKISNPKNSGDGEKNMMEKIISEAEKRFKYLSSDLKEIALREIKKIMGTNKDKQMSLIAYYFTLALGSRGEPISDDLIAKTGLANIFFWTAFIIYDDFWDEDESATPSILPCANLYARHYIDFYDNVLPINPEFRIFFHSLMDKLDAANTWETLHCRTRVIGSKFIIPDRLPDYKDYDFKYQPASGQILGPLMLLIKSGFKLNSNEANNLINYFKNYLIAMQINDDAHDWIEDMQRGNLSTVVVRLIRNWQEQYPDTTAIDLTKDLPKLQQLFWFKTIVPACQTAIYHTQKSREALVALTFLENPAPLARFIDISENVARQALDEQQKTLDLLQEFQ